MNQNKPQSVVNNLSSHASLLLSASPTIINSPLQTSTNNTSSFIQDDDLPGDNINFKKPQNEIFKKLDGKISRIVAAHSNLNKLYALNDFSGILGPKKPFELPPQLPRPPPWVPKVSNDCGYSQWTESPTNLSQSAPNLELPEMRTNTMSSLQPNNLTKITPRPELRRELMAPKVPIVTIDSAISKLHERRHQQQHQPQRQTPVFTQSPPKTIHIEAQAARQLIPSTSRLSDGVRLDYSKKTLAHILNPQRPKQTGLTISPVNNLTDEERRRFQTQLINLFREEIAAVSKLAKLKFTSPQADRRPQPVDQKSLLLKKSPQSIFNTIRRETSLLLNRREPVRGPGSSLLLEQQARNRANVADNTRTINRPIFNRYQMVKVIVPPTESFKHTCTKSDGKEGHDHSCSCNESKATVRDLDNWCPSRKFALKYRTLQLKMYLLRAGIKSRNNIGTSNQDLLRRKAPQKSLDKIVNRLQAKCSTSVSSAAIIQETNRLLQGSSPSPSPCQASQETTPSPPSSPKPIPVFRGPQARYGYNNPAGNSRAVNAKSKKAKRINHFGLKLGNYLERERPQHTIDKISVEQFAKCLNLVRSNDASLQRHREKILQSDSRWRMPVGDRPLRLRRIRGERVHMPASASYKATRRVGLK